MTLERFGGMLECLRGLPGLKKQEYVFITHNKMNINIYVDKLGKKIFNLSIKIAESMESAAGILQGISRRRGGGINVSIYGRILKYLKARRLACFFSHDDIT